jgi:hypothetical protein
VDHLIASPVADAETNAHVADTASSRSQTRAASAASRLSKSCTNVIRPSETVNTETKGASLSTRPLWRTCPGVARSHRRRCGFALIRALNSSKTSSRLSRVRSGSTGTQRTCLRVELGQTLEVASIVCVHRPGDDRECAQGVHKLDGAQPERSVNLGRVSRVRFARRTSERRMRTPSEPCGRESVVDFPPVTVLFAPAYWNCLPQGFTRDRGG